MFAASNITSLSKSIGYTRAKTYEFRKVKEDYTNRKIRFKKKPAISSIDSPLTNQTLLTSGSADTTIELGGMGSLPPAWVDVYEESQEKIKKVRNIHNEIQKLIAMKIKMQFGNHASLDAQIDRKNAQATELIQECEGHLHRISNSYSEESQSQTKIRKNTEKLLATQIQEVAVLLRKQQKGLLDRVKDMDGIGASELNNIEVNDQLYSEDLQEMILVEDIAQERDEDINKLIDNINKLNQLFRDMNQIVIEQGTIVDRIDYNIEQSYDNTVKAKKELVQANTAMNSKCGSHCIKILILLNIIFAVLTYFKFRSR